MLNIRTSQQIMKNFLASICLFVSFTSVADVVQLETRQGKLEGFTSLVNNEVRVFKGIPYAKPPVGNRRWTHAEVAGLWSGTLAATQFSPSCMQRPYPEGSFFSRPNPPVSEDCLYLNVWSGAKAGEKLPVMVWIHGGALTRGSGANKAYDGTALAAKGVVLVSINYRLDIFGYFSHPDLRAAETGKQIANFGTSDQIAALKWVRKYIKEYGGDPDNVTIFGESAGSFSVHHLMASEGAKGLFHRAIGQSGSSFRAMDDIREANNPANAMALRYQKKSGVSSFEDLKKMDGGDVLANAVGFKFRPVVDGDLFKGQIFDLFQEGKYNSVPLMVGFNAEEGTTLGAGSRVPKDKETYLRVAKKRYGDLAPEYLALYPANDLRKSTLNAFRDGFVTWGMQSWAMMMAQTNSDAYLYYFTFQPLGERLGAYHAAEIVYAFNNVKLVRDNAEKNHLILANSMSDYWVAFARTGVPNPKGLPEWPAYTKGKRQYIEFNEEIGARQNLLPGVWEFHEKLRR